MLESRSRSQKTQILA